VNGTGDHHVRRNKSDLEKANMTCFLWYVEVGSEEKRMDLNINGVLFRGSKSGCKEGKGAEYDQNTLYVCMKTSQ
jgi:hypothetical protein